jgi:hypothetical protein
LLFPLLIRYGELKTRWVSEEPWNFSVIWPGQQHSSVAAYRHVLLVLHGIDTFGHVVLNGRHVLAADNAHRCAGLFLTCGIEEVGWCCFAWLKFAAASNVANRWMFLYINTLTLRCCAAIAATA